MSGDMENTPGVGEDGQSSSQREGEVSSPVGDNTLIEQIKNLEAQVRGLQKSQDKRHAETKKTFHEFESEFDRMAAYLDRFDGDKDRAKREMQLDDLLAERNELTQQSSQRKQDVGDDDELPEGGVDRETLEFLGFDPNARDVVRMARKGFGVQDFIAVAQARGQQQANRQANPAGVQSMGEGRRTTSKEEQAVLQRDYERERDELVEKRMNNPRTMHALQKKYKKKGLPL